MHTRTLEPIIATHPFFAGLHADYLELVTRCAKNVRFGENEFLFQEGKSAEEFYLIREGRAALGISVPGRGLITFQTVGADGVLGWSWLFEPYGWLYHARALEPIRALAFDGVCLRNKCEEDHDFGYDFMKRFAGIMTERLQATRLQLLDVYAT